LPGRKLDVDFYEDTFVPSGFDSYIDAIGDTRQLISTSAHEERRLWEVARGLTVSDLDVVFVYPWPGEAQFIEELFDATASEGAILVLYHGPNDLVVYQRVVEEDQDPDMAFMHP
jgi:hypothetical protein